MPSGSLPPGASVGDQPSELVFSLTCSEKQVASLLGGGTPQSSSGPTVTFAADTGKKRERKQGDRSYQAGDRDRCLSVCQEMEEAVMPDSDMEFSPIKRQSDSLDLDTDMMFPAKSDLSPILSEPIMIPADSLSSNLSPTESQKNLSRSFEESRPRSLEIETEKDSNTSKGTDQQSIINHSMFFHLRCLT